MVRHRADASERSSTTAAHPVPDPSYTDGDRARAAHTRDSNRTHDSEDPERYDAQRTPSPPGPEANAPPPEEEVTKLRLSAHWAGLVLASMVGCLVRLGLDALGECESADPLRAELGLRDGLSLVGTYQGACEATT